MESQVEAPESRGKAGNATILLAALNILLIGLIAYKYLDVDGFSGDGVSIVLVNDTMEPMDHMSLSYPGGRLDIPQLDAGRSVGSPIPVPGEFQAKLTFKDGEGVERSEVIAIKPLGELLLILHVFPLLEESSIKGSDGEEHRVVQPAPGRYRIITSYKGEDSNI